MDKMKGLAKGGWHPSGDPKISRATWKSDVKGMATGKKKDPYESQRNHQSAPLSTLKDPSSFGAPPKHTAYYGGDSASASPITTTTPSTAMLATQAQPAAAPARGGLGAPVPTPSRRREEEMVEEEPPSPPQPYRMDTSGLRTDNLPKPPSRRVGNGDTPPPSAAAGRGGPPPVLPSRQLPLTAGPAVPARQTPPMPPRAAGPPPILPPRQNEYPDEHTPAPPPPYSAKIQQRANEAAAGAINAEATNRLGKAGIKVPGFGINASHVAQATSHASQQMASQQSAAPAAPSGSQLTELQQRFTRMGTSNSAVAATTSPPGIPASTGAVSHNVATAAATKKPPPPPPPAKKAALSSAAIMGPGNEDSQPPPLPLASKPRPT